MRCFKFQTVEYLDIIFIYLFPAIIFYIYIYLFFYIYNTYRRNKDFIQKLILLYLMHLKKKI